MFNYPTAAELLDAGYTLEPLYIRAEIMRALDIRVAPPPPMQEGKRSGLAPGITRVKKRERTYLYVRRKALADGTRPQKWFADTEEGLLQALEWREADDDLQTL